MVGEAGRGARAVGVRLVDLVVGRRRLGRALFARVVIALVRDLGSVGRPIRPIGEGVGQRGPSFEALPAN